MRRALVLLALLVACSKSDAEREKERIQDRAAQELKNLKEQLAGLEKQADVLRQRIDVVDQQLAKLYDELSKAIDNETRAAAVQKLDELQRERADIEQQLEALLKQVAN